MKRLGKEAPWSAWLPTDLPHATLSLVPSLWSHWLGSSWNMPTLSCLWVFRRKKQKLLFLYIMMWLPPLHYLGFCLKPSLWIFYLRELHSQPYQHVSSPILKLLTSFFLFFFRAFTFLWRTPAFSLSPSVLLYMNKWFWVTDNQEPSHPELLGSVDIWNYLQIWALLWKEDKSFIQLSGVSVIPWSLNRHQSYGLCWSGQAPQGTTDTREYPLFCPLLLVLFCAPFIARFASTLAVLT